MGKKTPLSPALGGGSRRDDAGGQLLRELEALSQVLYNAGQGNGRPPRKETPSSPALSSLPAPRRSQEALSPHLAGRPFQAPPSPHLGSRDSPSEEPPYAYANRRVRDSEQPRSPYLAARKGDGPPSPYLGGLNGPQPEARSPVIVSLNGTPRAGKPPRISEPVSPHLGGSRGFELPKSPQIPVRRSVDSLSSPYIEGRRGPLPRSPHLGGGQSVGSPSLRSHGRSPYLGAVSEESRSYESSNGGGMRAKGPQSPLGRSSSDSVTSLGSLNVTELTLTSAAAALRSPSQRPPMSTRSFSPLSQSVDSGSPRIEPYSLGGGRDSGGENGSRNSPGLKPWHSQGFERIAVTPEVTNFPGWLEDNVQFSKQLEAPKEKRSLWNWKPFRAIAHIGAQRFNCMFTVHVHGIEGLPAVTNGLRLAVSWKRKEAQAQSLPARVFQGSAEFEESLYLKSTVYGTKDGNKGIKFEPKCFDLAVIALDVDELVLGKHRLDLSRLVPKTPEGRDEENDRSWTTRFKLAGKAKGGTLIVTFACQLLNKNSDSASNLSSARFSDSPMVKPLRSYNSLPSSPEGTNRSGWPPANAANAFSPAMSEMPIDGEYMRMEHLSLNDEYSPAVDSGAFSSGKKSSQKGQSRPVFSDSPQPNDFPGSLKQLSYNQQAASSERQLMRKALSFDDDDGSEFTVVCQGHESSAIMDAGAPLEYDDPKADEDTVQGLPDGDTDADVHEEDSVAPQAGEDAPEVVKFFSDEKFSRKEQAEELGIVTLQSRNSQVAELGSDDMLFPEVGEADLVTKQSPVDVAVVEVEHKKEASVGEFNNSAIEEEEEEDVVDVQEDWNVSVVEDLDVLTKSWSVGVGERKNVVEEHEFCREDFLSDDKEDENATLSVIVVDSKDDEKAADVVVPGEENDKDDEKTTDLILMEKDDEEGQEEEKTIDVVVVKSYVTEEEESSDIGIQSMSTPPLQVKTKEEALEEDDYDRVYGEFMSLLRDPSPPCENSESGEDSPRAQLLKQFEQEALIEGGLELNFHLPEYAKFRVEGAQENKNDVNTPRAGDQPDSPMAPDNGTDVFDNSDWGNEDDVELAAIIEAAEAELEKATQILQSKARAKLLEDEETKALMQAWGLNDRAFEAAEPEPEPDMSDMMSMAIIVPAAPAPPLGNGLGPVLRFRDGGSVRSMSPAHFRGGVAGGRLLMQASNPVVVPSDMGATSMDILRRMAVAGMEGMAAQAMMAMPLEDLTGKALDQIPVVEQRPTPAGFTQPLGSRRHGYPALGHGENSSNTTTLALRENSRTSSTVSRFTKWSGSGGANSQSEEHMALEDLTPMAMLKIEALALEGLKIQAEMSDQDAPYAVEPDEASTVTRRGGLGLRVAGMALLEGGKSSARRNQGDFMSMDEWMRLDAGSTEDDDATADEQTTVATTQQQSSWKQKQHHKSGGRRGFMNDTVTLAMLVHLRDPLRSNEPVGAPMMALVQAERVTPPKLVGRRVRKSFSEQQEKSDEESTQPAAAQFKIVDITIAGLKTSATDSSNAATPRVEIWGTQKQLAAGSRWLAAHGMAKSSSNSFKAGKPASAKPASAPKSALWSMSERVYGSGARWRGAAPLHHPHIRNPDVLFADTGIRTF